MYARKYIAVALTALCMYSCGKEDKVEMDNVRSIHSNPDYIINNIPDSLKTPAKKEIKEDIFKDIDIFNLSDSLGDSLVIYLRKQSKKY